MDNKTTESIVTRFLHSLEDHIDYKTGNLDDVQDFAMMICDLDFEGMTELLSDKIINPKAFDSKYLELCFDLVAKTKNEDYFKVADLLLKNGAIISENGNHLLLKHVTDNDSDEVFDYIFNKYKENDLKLLEYKSVTYKAKLDFTLKKTLLLNAMNSNNFNAFTALRDDKDFFSSFAAESTAFKKSLVEILMKIGNSYSEEDASYYFFSIFRNANLMQLLRDNQELQKIYEAREILTVESLKSLELYHAL